MKTAISMPDEIFNEVNKFAKEHNYSRSEVFVIAIQDFLKKEEARKLLEALNEVYSEIETSEERTLREKTRKYYSKKVLREKY